MLRWLRVGWATWPGAPADCTAAVHPVVCCGGVTLTPPAPVCQPTAG